MSNTIPSSAVVIRPAHARDDAALARLASLDSKRIPAGHVLVAEVAGELQAALAVDSGAVIADPFRATADLVSMLEVHAETLREQPEPGPLARLLPRRVAAHARAA
jgi:hypothetical protein